MLLLFAFVLSLDLFIFNVEHVVEDDSDEGAVGAELAEVPGLGLVELAEGEVFYKILK